MIIKTRKGESSSLFNALPTIGQQINKHMAYIFKGDGKISTCLRANQLREENVCLFFGWVPQKLGEILSSFKNCCFFQRRSLWNGRCFGLFLAIYRTAILNLTNFPIVIQFYSKKLKSSFCSSYFSTTTNKTEENVRRTKADQSPG